MDESTPASALHLRCLLIHPDIDFYSTVASRISTIWWDTPFPEQEPSPAYLYRDRTPPTAPLIIAYCFPDQRLRHPFSHPHRRRAADLSQIISSSGRPCHCFIVGVSYPDITHLLPPGPFSSRAVFGLLSYPEELEFSQQVYSWMNLFKGSNIHTVSMKFESTWYFYAAHFPTTSRTQTPT